MGGLCQRDLAPGHDEFDSDLLPQTEGRGVAFGEHRMLCIYIYVYIIYTYIYICVYIYIHYYGQGLGFRVWDVGVWV